MKQNLGYKQKILPCVINNETSTYVKLPNNSLVPKFLHEFKIQPLFHYKVRFFRFSVKY